MSLKAWRAEANMGLQCFSEALRDLEDLCCARPNWAEVITQYKYCFSCYFTGSSYLYFGS